MPGARSTLLKAVEHAAKRAALFGALGQALVEAGLPGCRENFAALDRAFDRTERAGVSRAAIQAALDPHGSLFRDLYRASTLPALTALVTQLESALADAERAGVRDLDRLRETGARYRDQLTDLRALSTRLGLGERRAVAKDWKHATPAAVRGTFNRAGLVTERARAVYRLLAPRMPVQRKRGRKERDPEDVTYNLAAIVLTADLLSHAYWFCAVSPVTPTQLKARLQKRPPR